MTLHVALTHRTSYHYDHPVTLGPQTIRLRPAPYARIADPLLRPESQPAAAFPQLDAGPAGQFPRPCGLSGARHLLRGHGRSDRGHGHDQSVRLLPGTRGRNLSPSPTTRFWNRNSPRSAAPTPARPDCSPPWSPQSRTGETAHGRHAGRTSTRCVQSTASAYIVRMEPGVLVARGTRHWGRGSGSHAAIQRLAAGATAFAASAYAARFVSGYLIQLVADVKPAGRPHRPHQKTSPICTPGPRSISPAPAGSASMPPPA